MRYTACLLAGLALAPAAAANNSGLMALTPDGKRLAVAHTDAGTVSVLDVAGRKQAFEVPVGDHPEGVAWVGDTSLVLVTVWGSNTVVFVDAAAGKVVHTLPVANEPYGVVVTKDGRRAYVSHDYPGTVAEIDVPNRKVLRTFPAGACVRGIALSPDEQAVYATEFYTTKLVALSRETGKVVDSWAGNGIDNLCRSVTVHPTHGTAYLPHLQSRVTGHDARGSIFGAVSGCDLRPAKSPADGRRRLHSADGFNGVQVVSNPWEAAVSPDGKRLYLLYAGTDDLNMFDIAHDEYRDVIPAGGIPRVGKHPKAVRVSPDGESVYVYNSLDHEVGVYTKNVRRVAGIPTGTPAHTAEWRRGKELFVSARPPMGRVKWISCSSCHPDGLSDGRVWQNPEGDRRTTHLFGLAHTHPLHWSADRDEVQDFEYTIRGKLMRGPGLAPDEALRPKPAHTTPAELDHTLAGKSADLDALAVYTNSFEPRPSPHAAGPGRLTPEAERGKAVFFSPVTKCATCHTGAYYTDSTLTKPFKLHDVGTGGGPREKMGPAFDTPTLLSVYRAGPYLHDGRAAALMDVLTTHNTADRHGVTSHLSAADRTDLVAFLKSLPYEPLPDKTPNTVPHRLKR